jgi:cobalt-zinc-cadmium efflux system outer membrane protein
MNQVAPAACFHATGVKEVWTTMSCKRLGWLIGMLCLAGCSSSPTVRQNVDALLCCRADRLIDPEPLDLVGHGPPAVFLGAPSAAGAAAATPKLSTNTTIDTGLRLVVAQVPKEDGQVQKAPTTTLEKRLLDPSLEPNLPGSSAPPIEIGSVKKQPEEVLAKVAQKYFPPLPKLGTDPAPVPGPGGRPLALADLQKLAMTNSPLILAAASDIDGARGAAVQAGAYPNPTIGFTSQTQGPGGGPNYGAILSQTIKAPGKLKLAQAAALMDLENSRLAYRKAESDLMASVRTGYFAVLVAQENMKANRALVRLTDEVYKVMVDQLKVGEVATYEPMQVAVFAAQARIGLIQARNAYTLAWKQLAATLGLPAMPATEVAGRIDMPAPVYHFDRLLAHVLSRHTDVLTAQNTLEKARFSLRSAEITPIPDVTLQATVYNDVTPPGPNRIVTVGQVTIPLPLWDRNQGAIHQARAGLRRAVEEPHRVRDDLTGRLAEAYRRYDENRDLLQMNYSEILPKQVQAFRAAVKRHYGAEPDKVALQDLVSAEQNLVGVIGTYITTLGAFWQAVADVSALLQTDDVFQLADDRACFAPLPELDELLKLPCCHPCSPVHDPALRGANGTWPPAGFAAPAAGPQLPPPAVYPHK